MSIVFYEKSENIVSTGGGPGEPQSHFVVHNYSNEIINVYYIDHQGSYVLYGTLLPQGEYSQRSVFTHSWLIESESGSIAFKFFPTESGAIEVFPSRQTFVQSQESVVEGWSSAWGYGVPDVIKALNLSEDYQKLPENENSNNGILNLLNVPAAWQAGFTGSGVKVAVLDGGIYPHPEVSVSTRWDIFENDGDTTPAVSSWELHGLGVASVIAAKYEETKNSDSDEYDITGVSPDVELIDIKLSAGQGSTDKLIADSIIYATDLGAKVIQISQVNSDRVFNTLINEAVDYAYLNGALVIWAAGNFGLEGPTGPAGSSYLGKSIAVGNFDIGSMSPFSTSNLSGDAPSPFLFAPSTGYYPDYDNGYRHLNDAGTSFSSPYVSGIAALLFQKYPDASVSDIINMLLDSGWQPSIGQNAILDSAGNRIIGLDEFEDAELSPTVTDIVLVSGGSDQYKIEQSSGSRTIQSNDSSEIIDISGSERIQFDNLSVAYDLNDKAGDALELISALTGTVYLNDRGIIGQVIHLLDTNQDRDDVAQIAIDAVLGSNWDEEMLVQHLLVNVYGVTNSDLTTEILIDVKEQSNFTDFDLFWSIAESDAAHGIVDIVGLSQTGVEYIPFG